VRSYKSGETHSLPFSLREKVARSAG
jgi:hypothetical protein